MGISLSYLTKLLHNHEGRGFRSLLRQARVKAAEPLLRESLLIIKEIAVRVGYASTSQFDRDFRRELGVTPGGYRRTLPGTGESIQN
jgi:AraC family transcriptional regulator, transcriptional activator of pobA